jgi:hypothetical protein
LLVKNQATAVVGAAIGAMLPAAAEAEANGIIFLNRAMVILFGFIDTLVRYNFIELLLKRMVEI